MDNLGKRVFEYRIKHGLTQKQMADLCGITRVTIGSLESDHYHRPNFMTIHKVMRVLEKEEMNETEQYINSNMEVMPQAVSAEVY